MASPGFQRARSPQNKQYRIDSLVEAARGIALERGVAAVTLAEVAKRAGVHHTAVRRYFDSHREVLLTLVVEGWERWSRALDASIGGAQVNPSELADHLVATLAADPLFCDLLGNVTTKLERNVRVERVIKERRISLVSINRLVESVAKATPIIADRAPDVIFAATGLAGSFWQSTHPVTGLRLAYEQDPDLALVGADDFERTMKVLLTATCVGLAVEAIAAPKST